MRGPLREQIHNAINKALKENLLSVANSQAAYIHVGGRRRNRKKKKDKKNGGSPWAEIKLCANEPPLRSRLDIPPKAKCSPPVAKNKKASKELKTRLSPSRCLTDNSPDNKPLIDNDGGDDEHKGEADPENVDQSVKKDAEVLAANTAGTSQFDAVLAEAVDKKDLEAGDGAEVKQEDLKTGESHLMVAATDVSSTNDKQAIGEGGDLVISSTGSPSTLQAQPKKLELGTLPPESGLGRERQSLLHEHNPDAMVCCTIL